jgi:hypothetical protein
LQHGGAGGSHAFHIGQNGIEREGQPLSLNGLWAYGAK